MEDSLRNDVKGLCKELADRDVGNVVGLAMGPECSWTSYLVVGTVKSRVHMNGAVAAAADFIHGMGLECATGKRSDDNPWKIVDGGNVVVSLMDDDSRNFYDLEDRWYGAEKIF